MTGLTLLYRTLLLDKQAIQTLSESKQWNMWARIVVIALGVVYGIFSIRQNATYIASFETDFLRTLVVPGIFIFFGIVTMVLTRLGLALLLWAGARGLGGPGFVRNLTRASSFALIPSMLAIPAFISLGANDSISIIQGLATLLGIIWIYRICVKTLETTQGFMRWRANVAVIAIFIFFICIYYIVTPPS
ncbi:YIP1 family protein [Desertibacillus haloalkaliphilus]|uniref:YIP1 family protein n=1 Tax=Desertibacillus haloalkaliphilus TaxID=1328930 RepID=UPI001C25B0E9|nr:YIP1 family protein [Desertibacillus haloalkaliphilus]MBU8905550.1 YIP1 family protein [Desertibacillus haloalkaliphilus]